jgi:hypothetical protein
LLAQLAFLRRAGSGRPGGLGDAAVGRPRHNGVRHNGVEFVGGYAGLGNFLIGVRWVGRVRELFDGSGGAPLAVCQINRARGGWSGRFGAVRVVDGAKDFSGCEGRAGGRLADVVAGVSPRRIERLIRRRVFVMHGGAARCRAGVELLTRK